jgi:hypothetical protein
VPVARTVVSFLSGTTDTSCSVAKTAILERGTRPRLLAASRGVNSAMETEKQ